jgi:DNA polymerase-3 subunit beta
MLKLTVKKKELEDALTHAARVAERKGSMEALKTVLLKAGDGELVLTATDLTLSLAVPVDALVEEPGALCVPVHTLLAMVKTLAAERVTLEEQANNRLKIEDGQSSFKLSGLQAGDFPSWPEVEDPIEVSVSCEALKGLFKRTQYVAAEAETKTGGVLIEPNGDVLTTVAVATYRIAVAEGELEDKAQKVRALVPLKAVNEAMQFLGSSEDVVVLTISKNRIGLTMPGAVMVSRLLEQSFPKYESVIPKDSPGSFTVRRADLAAAMHRVQVVSDYVNIEVEGKHLSVYAKTDMGEVKDRVDVEDFKGEPYKAKHRLKHLLEPLGPMTAEHVTFEISDAKEPILIKEGEDHLCVVSPVIG